MNEKPVFKYFHGKEADLYTFYRIPKQLFTNDFFKTLSTDAKVLYGLMLDRMSLSIKNNWFDAQNRAYIYFSIEDTMELLNCKKNKAVQTIAELDSKQGIGLIEKKRQGQGKPTIIYVKSFSIPEKNAEMDYQGTDPEVGKTNFKITEKQTSKGLYQQHLEVLKTNPNKNYLNNNNLNNTETYHIQSMDGITDMNGYATLIKGNLEMNILRQNHPYDQELIEGLYSLILETVLMKGDKILIAGNTYPLELVKSKFLKLDSGHIEYVMDCFLKNTTKVRNIKKYLMAALFNAPTTIGGYYQAEVNHDMPQFVKTTV